MLAVRVWDGGGSDALWTTAANWAGDVAPMADDNLVFPDGLDAAFKTGVNDYLDGTRFRTITISDDGFKLSGNPLTLGEGFLANFGVHLPGSSTFTAPITLGTNLTLQVTNAGATVVLGSIDTGNLLTATFETAGAIQVGGTAGNPGVISGRGGINKYGTGTLILSGNNTYEGITTIAQGAINVRHNNALGSTVGATHVGAWTSLELEGGVTVAEPMYVQNWGNESIDFDHGGALHSVRGNNRLTGLITLGRNDSTTVCVERDSYLTITGKLLGYGVGHNQQFRKFGAGTLELAGTESNDFNGDVQVHRGTLKLNKSGGALAFNSAQITVGDNMYVKGLGAGDESLGDNDSVLEIAQSHQFDYVDLVDVNLRTLNIQASGLVRLAPGVSQTVGHLVLTVGPTWSGDLDVSDGTLTVLGNLTLNADQGSSGGTAEGVYDGSPASRIYGLPGGHLDLGSNWSGIGSATTTYRTLQINDTSLSSINPDLEIAVPITGVSEDVMLTKNGWGTLKLSATNTYAGPTGLREGYVMVAADNPFSTGELSFWSGVNLIADSVARTIGNELVSVDADLNVFSFATVGTGRLTFTAPTVLMNGSKTMRVFDPAQEVLFTGAMTEGPLTGASAYQATLYKHGRGTLILEGALDLTGSHGVRVNHDGGTLVLRKEAALPGTATNHPESTLASWIEINTGGTIVLDNSVAGYNLSDRIADGSTVRLYGGTLALVGADGQATTEYLGHVDQYGTAPEKILSRVGSGAGSSNELTIGYLNRSNGAGAQVQFIGQGTDLSATGDNRVVLKNAPSWPMRNGVLPYALVAGSGGYDLATLASVDEGMAVVPLPAGAYTTDLSQAGPTSNVKLTASQVLSTSTTINALILAPGVTLSGATDATTLTLDASVIVLGGGSGLAVPCVASLSNLDLGITVTADATRSNPATIASILRGGQRVSKGGAGMLVLSGANEFTGECYVQEGILNLRHSSALGAPSAQTVVYAGAALELEDPGTAGLHLATEQIELNGTGIQDARGYQYDLGALRNVRGDNSIAGTIRQAQRGTGVFDGWTLLGATNSHVMTPIFYGVDAGSTLALTGAILDNVDLVKVGGGTLASGGVVANTYSASTRVKEGTLVFAKADGLAAHAGGGWVQVGGTYDTGAARLVYDGADDYGNEQVHDDASWVIGANGAVDFQGHREILEYFWLIVGPAGGATVDLGAGGEVWFDRSGDGDLLAVQTIGTGNPTGARFLNGTMNLNTPGSGDPTSSWHYRRILVNRGLTAANPEGTDLLVTSAVADGSSRWQVPLQKYGFGTLELAGTGANTFGGQYYSWQGVTLLNKGDGVHGGVSAVGGALRAGDAGWGDGGQRADVVRWLQPDQLPDTNADVYVDAGSWLDLNGFDETLGTASLQVALNLGVSADISTGAGTLSLNGNLTMPNRVWGVPATFSGNLDLGGGTGASSRTLEIPNRAGHLPYELILSARLTSPSNVAMVKTSDGAVLVSGNNTDLAGSVFLQAGGTGIGSNMALGTGTISMLGSLMAEYGPRVLSNDVLLDGSITLGNYSTGANDLVFTGGVTLTSDRAVNVNYAQQVTFAGGLGESMGRSSYFNKQGIGRVAITAPALHSGTTYVDNGGGALLLQGQGALVNTSSVEIRLGATFQVYNTAVNLPNRIRDLANVLIRSGSLVYVGTPGETSTETVNALSLMESYTVNAHTVISQVSPAANSAVRLTFSQVNNNNQLNQVNFVGIGKAIGDEGNQVRFDSLPPTFGGILPYGILTTQTVVAGETVVDVGFAGYDTLSHQGLYDATTSTDLGTATAADNVKLSADGVFSGTKTVNALLMLGSAGGVTLTLGAGANLTLAAGTLIASSPFNTLQSHGVAGPGTLTLGAAPNVYTDRRTTNTIGAVVAQPALVTNTITVGGKGTLVLAGANTFDGAVNLLEGVVRLTHDQGLGSTLGGTTVRTNAQLQLQGNLTVGDEALSLYGNGPGTGANRFENTGALRLLASSGAQTVTWGTGATSIGMNFDSNNGLMVDAAGDRLTLNGTLGINRNVYKLGRGALELAGSADNTQTNSPAIYVHGGTLLLNKAGGSLAIPSGVNLIVGKDYGGDNTEVLRFGAGNQLPSSGAVASGYVQLRASGLLDLAGYSQTLVSNATATLLYLTQGITAAADVVLGGGTLTLGTASVQTNVQGYRSYWGGSTGVTIAGGTVEIAAAGVNLYIDDGYAHVDVDISASLSGSGVLTRNTSNVGDPSPSASTLALSSTGSAGFTGSVVVAGGELLLKTAQSLGNATRVTVNAGGNPGQAVVLAEGLGTVSGPELYLPASSGGYGGAGVLRSLGGTNTWAGSVVLSGASGNARIGVLAGELILSGQISESGGTVGLDKMLPGTLTYAGAVGNTYNGQTNVWEGALRLNKGSGSGGVDAIHGGLLYIGNDAGSGGDDQVILVQPNQINDAANVEIRMSGKLDLNGQNETTHDLDLVSGTSGSQAAVVDLKGAQLGLSAGARIVYDSWTTFEWSPTPKILSSTGGGSLALGTSVKEFNIGDPWALSDFAISVPLTAGSGGGFRKTGGGTLLLAADSSSFTGSVELNAGYVAVDRSTALGPNSASSPVISVTGAAGVRAEINPAINPAAAAVVVHNNFTLGADLYVTGYLSQAIELAGKLTPADAAHSVNVYNSATTRLTGTGARAGGTSIDAAGYGVSINTLPNSETTVSGRIIGSGPLGKSGLGPLTLSGNNTFTGVFTVANNGGLVILQSDTALGTAWGYTDVGSCASVVFGGGRSVAETFVISQNGYGNTNWGSTYTGALRMLDTQPGTAQAATLSGDIILGASLPAIGVDGPEDTLLATGMIHSSEVAYVTATGTWTFSYNGETSANILLSDSPATVQAKLEAMTSIGAGEAVVKAGALANSFVITFTRWHGSQDLAAATIGGSATLAMSLSGRSQGLNKVGSGTLELAGTTASCYNGTTQILEGTLLWNTPELDVLLPGALVVGDGGGPDNGDAFVLGQDNGMHYLRDVTVASSGRVDLGGYSARIGTLTLLTGPTASANVSTGAGLLTVSSDLTVSTSGATDGASPAARVEGHLGLDGSLIINDTLLPSTAEDLVLDCTLAGWGFGAYAPGLWEGRVSGNNNTADANPASSRVLYPRMAETNVKPPWGDEETWIYTGQIYDADGIFSLAESIDDNTRITVDGVLVLYNTAWNVPTTTGSALNNAGTSKTDFGMGPAGDGWHDIEVRISNGGGGAGAVGGTGWTATFGFGLYSGADPVRLASNNGADYVLPADDGSMNLFRCLAPAASATTFSGSGTVALAANTSFADDLVISGPTVVLRGGGSLASATSVEVASGTLVLDNSAATANRLSDANVVELAGGTLSLIGNAAGTTETVGTLRLAADTSSTVRSAPAATGTTTLAIGSIDRQAGALVSLVGSGTDLGTGNNRITVTGGAPGFVGSGANAILPYATVTGPAGFDLVADVDSSPTAVPYSLGRVASYATTLTAGANVKLTAGTTLSGNASVNSLWLAGDGISVDLGANSLTVNSGVMVGTGGANAVTATSGNLSAFGGEAVFQVGELSTLSVNSPLWASSVRKELSGTLVLGADNASLLSGSVSVGGGTLQITHAGALGTAAAGTSVASGAALELALPGATLAEPLTLGGLGASVASPGALRVLDVTPDTAQTVTLTGPITLTSDAGIAVVGGGSNADVLQIGTGTASIIQGLGGLVKTGPGILELGGSASNTFSGAVNVRSGTLRLAKTAGRAVPNGLVVGDDTDSLTDRVTYTGTSTDQVNGNVTINPTGILDAAGKADGVSVMTINGGSLVTAGTGNYSVTALTMTGSSITTSGGASFILYGAATINPGPQSRISGKLHLGNGDRSFAVNDGLGMYDLLIDADISGGGTAGRFSKNGAGAVLLTGDNKNLTGRSEVQTLTLDDTVTSFTLSFHGSTTGAITIADPNATAANAAAIQAALLGLASVGAGNVVVAYGTAGTGTHAYNVTFQNNLGGFDVYTLAAAVLGGSGAVAVTTPTGGVWAYAALGGVTAIGSDTALGTGGVAVNNATLWAYGGERTVKWLHVNNATAYLGARRDWGPVDPETGKPYALSFGSGQLWEGTTNLQVDDPAAVVRVGGRNAQQLVSFQSAPAAGTWTLTFDGATTAPLSFNASAADVAAKINALSTIVNAGAWVDVIPSPGPYGFIVTFEGGLARTNVKMLTATTSTLSPTTGPMIALLARGNGGLAEGIASRTLGKNGAGMLVLGGVGTYQGDTNVNAGILRLTDGRALGNNTTPVSVSGNAALELDGSDTGSVDVAGHGLILYVGNPPRYAGGAYNNLGGAMRSIAGENSWTAEPACEIQQIAIAGSGISGTFTISYGGQAATIGWTDTAADVQAKLAALSTIGAGNVVVYGTPATGLTLIFQGTLRNAPLALVTVDSSGLAGTGVSATVTETVRGTNGIDVRTYENTLTGRAFYVGVDAGTLTLNAEILGTNSVLTPVTGQSLVKVGDGTLVVAGEAANSLSGDTVVLEGTLELAKQSIALYGGTIYVGESSIGSGTDTLRITGPEQVADTLALSLASCGRLEVASSGTSNEVQSLAFAALPTTGTWAIRFGGQTTVLLPCYATPSLVEWALNQLDSITASGGRVSVSGSPSIYNATVSAVGSYLVTFLDGLAGAAQAPLEIVSNTTGQTVAVSRVVLGGLSSVETVGALTGMIADVSSATISIESGALLDLAGDVTFHAFPGTLAGSTASISGAGRLGLLPAVASASASRTITVNAAPAGYAVAVTARIVDGGMLNYETHSIAFPAQPTAGTWSITILGQSVSGLAYNVTAVELQAAINSVLAPVYPGTTVSVATVGNSYTYALTFAGFRGPINETAPLLVSAASLTPGTAPAVIETVRGGNSLANEVQTVGFSAAPTAGTWSLSFNGQTASGLAFGISPADLQTALNGLSTIGGAGGSVGVAAGANAYTYVITFQGALAATDVSLLTAALDTGFAPVTVTVSVTETVRGGGAAYQGSLVKAGWAGSRLTLDSASANTYHGATTVSAGNLDIRRASALGYGNLANPGSGTVVSAGAVLELDGGLTVTDEPLTLAGQGHVPVLSSTWSTAPSDPYNGTPAGVGALRARSGANVWTGTAALPVVQFTAGSDVAIGADQDASLDIRGILATGTGYSLLKTGAGTLTFSSLGHVPGTGNTGTYNLRVLEGTAVVDKAGNDVAFWNDVFVGDAVGGSSADVLRFGSHAGSNQIDNARNLVVRPSGLVDMAAVGSLSEIQSIVLSAQPASGTWTVSYGGRTTAALPYHVSAAALETALNGLTSIGGAGASVRVLNGANSYSYLILFQGSLGNINVTNSVSASVGSLLTAASGTITATISEAGRATGEVVNAVAFDVGPGGQAQVNTGSVALGVLSSPEGGVAVFTVTMAGTNSATLPALLAGRLDLSADERSFWIRDSHAPVDLLVTAELTNGGVLKHREGTLELAHANNTYTGYTSVVAGTLIVSAEGALGGLGGTGVGRGATLALRGDLNYTYAERLALAGDGADGQGALVNLGGTSTFAGPIRLSTLTTSATIASRAGKLTLTGSVDLQTSHLELGGEGELELAGAILGTAASYATGLLGYYYTFNTPAINPGYARDELLQSLATMEAHTPQAVAQTLTIDMPNFSAYGISAGEDIVARWVGQITAPSDGLYRFGLISDDGSMIFLDGTLVVNHSGYHGIPAAPVTGEVYLTAGKHEFVACFFERGGAQEVHASWAKLTGSDAFSTRIIESSAFSFTPKANALAKTGSGTVTLSGDNAFTGAVTVEQGKLIAAHNRALGSQDAGTTLADGAILGLQGGVSVAEDLTFLGDLALEGRSGANRLEGAAQPIAVGGDLAITVLAAADSLTLAEPFTGSAAGNLAKSGPGTLVVHVNLECHDAQLDAGTLQLDAPYALTAASLDVGPVATLAGNGQAVVAASATTSGGTLDPGTAGIAGVLSVDGNLAMDLDGEFHVDLGGLSPGTQHDQLFVDGQVELNGVTLTGSRLGGFIAEVGDRITILESSQPVLGTFAHLEHDGDIISLGGSPFSVHYNDGGNNVVLVRQRISASRIVYDAGLDGTGDDAQWSMITRIDVYFDGLLTGLDDEAFSLTRSGSTAGPVNLVVSPWETADGLTVARLTFRAGPEVYRRAADYALVDGTYELHVAGALLTDELDDEGASSSAEFYRLFGDGDADLDVDPDDLFQIRQAMSGDARFAAQRAYFDHDGDLDVDAADYRQFRLHYGRPLP